MSEPKVIELTEEEMKQGISPDKMHEFWRALKSYGVATFKAPQPKLVHLSDLPDGTRVEIKGVMSYFVVAGKLASYLYVDGDYSGWHTFPDDTLSLVQGEFQFWQGGHCPWPEGVEVEMEYVTRTVFGELQKHTTIGAAERLIWADDKDSLIIAHRCTGRLLDGAKLVP